MTCPNCGYNTDKISRQAFTKFFDGILKDYFGLDVKEPANKKSVAAAYRRFSRSVKDILSFANEDPDLARAGTDAIINRMNKANLSSNLDTVAKNFLVWKSDPKGWENETYKQKY